MNQKSNIIPFFNETKYANKEEEDSVLFELFKIQHVLEQILREEVNMPEIQCPAIDFSVCKSFDGQLVLSLIADNKHYDSHDIVNQVNVFKNHLIKKWGNDRIIDKIDYGLNNIKSFNENMGKEYIAMPVYTQEQLDT